MATKKGSDVPSAAQISRAIRLAKSAPDLYLELMLAGLKKAETPTQRSNQERTMGRKEHPFNMRAVDEYPDFNTTHSACLETKRSATVSHRHKEKKIYETLNPLCKVSWQDVLDRMALDYWKTGNGYIEVVHGDPSNLETVTGLHFLPARTVWVHVEETAERDYHYVVQGTDERLPGRELRFARFGDLASFRERATAGKTRKTFPFGEDATKSVSEVIHWQFPNTHSQWYGRPEYFAAIPSIELVQCMTQREFNFFFNNGVPEFLLFFLGAQLSAKDWEKVESTLRAGQGLKGGHLSAAFNLDNPEMTVQLEKVGLADSGGDKSAFIDRSQVTAMNIATAHQVPPLLAGILIPGRMGGTNEGPNNLMLFQAQKVAPAQKALSDLLAQTLGSSVPLDGGKALTAEDFQGTDEDKGNGFNRVTDEIDMFQMDTVARMKTPLGEGGRDPAEGLRENGQDRSRTGGGPRTA